MTVTEYIKQIQSYEEYSFSWCEILKKKYTIPNTYQTDMWKLNTQAMNGTPGIWTHVSFRADKSDCHPQLSLINLLKGLGEDR